MLEIAGIELLPDWATFVSFALAALALNILPGADMTFVMANAARNGRRAGIIASLGIGAGAFAHILAAVLGLSAILASSQMAFNLVRWIGAAYLLYLAVSLLLSGNSLKSDAMSAAASDTNLFRRAALINILNPKVALFFLAFLPQFVDPDARVPALQIFALGVWFVFGGTVTNLIVAIATASASKRLSHLGWLRTTSRWLAGTMMGAMAFKLAFASGSRST